MFEGRYKSCLVKEDSYFLQTSRYIHLNPVEAGMVKYPEEYRWSSYRTMIGLSDIINISSVAAVAHIPFQAFYSASKAAISSYSCALDNEVKPYGIQVTVVELGDIHTGFTQARQKVIVGDKEYGGRISRSVSQMEKDEQNGANPEVIGAYIAKIAEKKCKPICVAGAQYKFLSLLCKLLPCGIRGKIVGAIYAK